MDAKFVPGMFAKKPHERAPDFVKARLSIKVPEVREYLGAEEKEWINLDLKESRDGKYYLQVDEWEPSGDNRTEEPKKELTDVPF